MEDAKKETNGHGAQCDGSHCSGSTCCGGKHSHSQHLVKLFVAVLILLITFLAGAKIGFLVGRLGLGGTYAGQFGRGYYGGHMMMYPGGYWGTYSLPQTQNGGLLPQGQGDSGSIPAVPPTSPNTR